MTFGSTFTLVHSVTAKFGFNLHVGGGGCFFNLALTYVSLLKVLSNWQRFRDEQLILLNWLSNKEKTLKDMGRTDLSNEEEVKDHLEKLRVRNQ